MPDPIPIPSPPRPDLDLKGPPRLKAFWTSLLDDLQSTALGLGSGWGGGGAKRITSIWGGGKTYCRVCSPKPLFGGLRNWGWSGRCLFLFFLLGRVAKRKGGSKRIVGGGPKTFLGRGFTPNLRYVFHPPWVFHPPLPLSDWRCGDRHAQLRVSTPLVRFCLQPLLFQTEQQKHTPRLGGHFTPDK